MFWYWNLYCISTIIACDLLIVNVYYYFPTLYKLLSPAISELSLAARSIFIPSCHNCLRSHDVFRASFLIMLFLNPINNWSLIAMSSAEQCLWSHLWNDNILLLSVLCCKWWKCFIFVLHKGSKLNVLQCWIFCWLKTKVPLWLQNFPMLRYF